MQTAMHPAFEQKLAVLAALLERSKSARQKHTQRLASQLRVTRRLVREDWDVVEIATGAKQGFAYSYRTAMRFVDAMEAGAASKQGGVQ